MSSPCYGCKKRSMDCHGRCEEYRDFAADCEKARRERFMRYITEHAIKTTKPRNYTIVEQQIKRNHEKGE